MGSQVKAKIRVNLMQNPTIGKKLIRMDNLSVQEIVRFSLKSVSLKTNRISILERYVHRSIKDCWCHTGRATTHV